jgi:hypothetical protein
LITKRNRGANIWIFSKNYPETVKKFCSEDKTIKGEIRSNGGQTIISGIHQDTGKPYTFINKVSPLFIPWNEINFLDSVMHRSKKNICISKTLNNCIDNNQCIVTSDTTIHNNRTYTIDAPLHNTQSLSGLERKKHEELVLSKFKNQHPHEYNIFLKRVKNRINPSEGERNDLVIKTVTYLFQITSKEFCLTIQQFLYESYSYLFKDSLDQHLKEAEAHWNTLQIDFESKLSSDILTSYKSFTEREQLVFKICFHLANQEEDRKFYISCEELGLRIGIASTPSHRILKDFIRWNILQIVEKGKRRVKGETPIATTYRWMINNP